MKLKMRVSAFAIHILPKKAQNEKMAMVVDEAFLYWRDSANGSNDTRTNSRTVNRVMKISKLHLERALIVASHSH